MLNFTKFEIWTEITQFDAKKMKYLLTNKYAK